MKNLTLIFFISLFLSPLFIKAQDTIPQSSIHSIFDIPHKTIWQKWMWIHRSVAFMIIKDRKPYFDTTYVKTYKKSVSVTVPVSSRFLRFNLVDWSSGNTLKYSPNNSYDLGFGVSSRWATFQLLTGVRIFENYKNQKGETHYHDTQFNIYSPRVTCDIFYQNYKSFYIRNSLSYPDYTGITRYAVRSDINAVSFGVSSYYVFNSKKFSYRSAFAYTEVQKKSSGSFLAGTYFFLFNVKGDSTLVGFPFRPLFDSLSFIKNATVQTYGINIGYIHTFIFWKRFYTTISLVQGLGLEQTLYKNTEALSYSSPLKGAAKINCRYAFGYNLGRFYIGTMGILDYLFFTSKSNTTFNFNTGKITAFIGYRFYFVKKERQILRALNLIDYRL